MTSSERRFTDFGGVKRRFTKTGQVGGITVIDDYGHHPVEIKAALATAREASAGRVIAVIQPHRYTRLEALFDDFCHCADDADIVLVTPVYAAGEQPIPGIDQQALIAGLKEAGVGDVRPIEGPDDLADKLTRAGRASGYGDLSWGGDDFGLGEPAAGEACGSPCSGERGMSGAWIDRLPKVRGKLDFDVPMAPKTWFRVGGPARCWFQPADLDDLADFMALKPADIPVLPIGVASNLLVRDGGIDAVVLRLTGPLAKVEADGDRLTVGPA